MHKKKQVWSYAYRYNRTEANVYTVCIILIAARFAGNWVPSINGHNIEKISFVGWLPAISVQHSSAVLDTYGKINLASLRSDLYIDKTKR